MSVTNRRISNLEDKLDSLNAVNKPTLKGLSDEELEELYQKEFAEFPPQLTGDDFARFFRRWNENPAPSFKKLMEQAQRELEQWRGRRR